MSSDVFEGLLVVTVITLAAGLLTWFRRPSARSSLLFRGVLIAAGAGLALELAFVAVFIAVLAGMPDMSEF